MSNSTPNSGAESGSLTPYSMPPPRIRPSGPPSSLAMALPLRPSIMSRSGSHLRINSSTPLLQCQPRTQIRSLKSISRPAPSPDRFNTVLSPLAASPAAARARRLASDTLPLRTGVIATKKGMTALFDPETGIRTPCTVLQIDRAQVVAHKTRRRHGYFAVCLGSGWRRPENVGRAMMGVFAAQQYADPATGESRGLAPKRFIREFQVRDEKGLVPVGTSIGPSWFTEGQWVDVQGNSRGMGFEGGMKRWGWHGQPASHGVSLTHRSMGSAGGGQGSGSRVHPGKKMAGNMGNQNHTVQNLKVLKVDEENGIVVISGAVPGPKKGLVKIRDSVKKSWPEIARNPPVLMPEADVAAAEGVATQA